MSNSLGLALIGLGIAMLVAFVLLIHYLATNHSDSKIGRIAKKINAYIDQLPD
jgi:hypothetical protein